MTGVKKAINIIELIPGLLLVLAITLSAWYAHKYYQPISAVAIAIIAGVLIRNVIGLPEICKAGQSLAVRKILRLGIVLLGVRLSFLDMVKIGGNSLIIIILCITMAIILIRFISHKLGLPDKLGTLIGVGTSICGASAIVATAPAIGADEEETAFAVGTITAFGLLAVLVYPFIGRWINMSDVFFGTWAGVAVNDTSQVVATGAIYSERALEIATTVKLTRNLFMAPVMVLLSAFYMMKRVKEEGKAGVEKKKLDYMSTFPFFVLGFIGMTILRSMDVFTPAGIGMLGSTASFLIVMALAGVGLGTSFASMKKIGFKPFYAGMFASILLAGTSFLLIKLFDIG